MVGETTNPIAMDLSNELWLQANNHSQNTDFMEPYHHHHHHKEAVIQGKVLFNWKARGYWPKSHLYLIDINFRGFSPCLFGSTFLDSALFFYFYQIGNNLPPKIDLIIVVVANKVHPFAPLIDPIFESYMDL